MSHNLCVIILDFIRPICLFLLALFFVLCLFSSIFEVFMKKIPKKALFWPKKCRFYENLKSSKKRAHGVYTLWLSRFNMVWIITDHIEDYTIFSRVGKSKMFFKFAYTKSNESIAAYAVMSFSREKVVRSTRPSITLWPLTYGVRPYNYATRKMSAYDSHVVVGGKCDPI